MNIRSFGWRDLPLLSSYRNRGLFLDSSRILIHGPIMVPLGALITFFGPHTRIYTYRCENPIKSGQPLIGQVNYLPGDSYAKLSFLAPEESIEQNELSALSDFLAVQINHPAVIPLQRQHDAAMDRDCCTGSAGESLWTGGPARTGGPCGSLRSSGAARGQCDVDGSRM